MDKEIIELLEKLNNEKEQKRDSFVAIILKDILKQKTK